MRVYMYQYSLWFRVKSSMYKANLEFLSLPGVCVCVCGGGEGAEGEGEESVILHP